MSITDTMGWNPEALDEILSNDEGRPVLFTNARILTMDPLIGTMTGADLLFVGPLVVGVGPAIVTAAGDDNAIVVDCTGLTIAPAVVDAVALAGGRGHRSEYVATLTPGNTADFLVVPDELATDVPSAVATFVTRPEQVHALVAAGRPVLWAGTAVWAGADVPGRASRPPRTSTASASPPRNAPATGARRTSAGSCCN
ncbi:amidohydrolase [Streptomyces scopuliridis]|uniref:amidohydrolase n=1 Tax=Streptomyces scopuliridis TaxID=452529 RepID=UPI0036CC1E42